MQNNEEKKSNKSSNFLANIFNWSSEIVEAAESPFARFAAFLLPILAPVTPAFLTSLRLYGLFLTLTDKFKLPSWVALTGAILTAIVLEILGYVGTIAMVRFIYKWIKTKTDEFLVPTIMSGLAYVFYLATMYFINVQLSLDNPDPTKVFTLLGFLTIPAGLIFATNLVTSQEEKNEFIIRQEKREDKIKTKMINKGINPLTLYSANLGQNPIIENKNEEIPSATSTDWRVVSKNLSQKDILFIANCTDWKIVGKMYNLSERSARNWIGNAQKKLGR